LSFRAVLDKKISIPLIVVIFISAIAIAIVRVAYQPSQSNPQFNVTFQYISNQDSTGHFSAGNEHLLANISLTNKVTLKNVQISYLHIGTITGTMPPNSALARCYYSYECPLLSTPSWNGSEITINKTINNGGVGYATDIIISWNGGQEEFTKNLTNETTETP